MECYEKYFIHNFKLKQSSVFEELVLSSGISIYEVIKIEQGIPLFLENHLNRLFSSADLSNLSINESYCDLEKLISELINRNKATEGKIKLVIRFDKNSRSNEKDLLIYFTPYSYPTADDYRFGVKIGLCKAVRTNPNAKILNTEARNKANEVIAKSTFFEVLLVDDHGFITEGSKSNIFFIKDSQLITPPESAVLNGVTRKNILKICKQNKIDLLEEKISISDIKNMDSAFLTGTSLNVLPVHFIEEIEFKTENKILKRLVKLYELSVVEYISLKKLESGEITQANL
ncbi:MAG TPA: aminotransferase class IV [Bacteroidales bacterium]|jgi:branched-chain amino acid aminotransferase|nr:aminotransferase class IV [Bacteroidales bacterium]